MFTDIKERLINQGLKLIQNPQVSKLAQNEQVIQAAMKVLELSSKLDERLKTEGKRLARKLQLVTVDDLRQLRDELSKAEQELSRISREARDSKRPGPDLT